MNNPINNPLKNLSGINFNADYEKLTLLVNELQSKDIRFDIRLTTDMHRSLLLDKLEKRAIELNKNLAANKIKEWVSDLELITFNHLRTSVFNTDIANLFIMSGELSKKIDFAIVLSKILGVDDKNDK